MHTVTLHSGKHYITLQFAWILTYRQLLPLTPLQNKPFRFCSNLFSVKITPLQKIQKRWSKLADVSNASCHWALQTLSQLSFWVNTRCCKLRHPWAIGIWTHPLTCYDVRLPSLNPPSPTPLIYDHYLDLHQSSLKHSQACKSHASLSLSYINSI